MKYLGHFGDLPERPNVEFGFQIFMSKLVLLVDDNHLMRKALRMLFESVRDFEVIGEAAHGREAIEKARTLRPHLIILDFSMPVMNGLEAAPLLLQILPTVILVLFTNYVTESLEVYAHTAGVHAVVHKHQGVTHLLPTVRALFAGQPLPPRVRKAVP
jgi:DNA-binding NarL/FixJ family response regulator